MPKDVIVKLENILYWKMCLILGKVPYIENVPFIVNNDLYWKSCLILKFMLILRILPYIENLALYWKYCLILKILPYIENFALYWKFCLILKIFSYIEKMSYIKWFVCKRNSKDMKFLISVNMRQEITEAKRRASTLRNKFCYKFPIRTPPVFFT